MTKAQKTAMFAAFVRAVKDAGLDVPVVQADKKADKPFDRKADYRDKVRKGFKKRGISLTFNADSGRFDDVLPYKDWQALGWQVRKGQKSVRGVFHKSQCDQIQAPVA